MESKMEGGAEEDVSNHLALLNDAFSEFAGPDAPHKGGEPVLTAANLTKVLREELGVIKSPDEVKDMIAAYDMGRNGSLSFKDFVGLMNSNPDAEYEQHERNFNPDDFFTRAVIHDIFQVCDQDGDGTLSFADLRAVVNEHLEEEITDAELMSIVQTCDSRNGTKISYQTFSAVMSDESNN